MKDMYNVIQRWDSHAGVNLKNTYSDTTSYIVNSFGHGYIYVSSNSKIDNIFRIYRELIEGDVTKLTINLTTFDNFDSYAFILSILVPLLVDSQKAVYSYDDPNLLRTFFEYNVEGNEYSYYTNAVKTDTVAHKYKFDRVNIIAPSVVTRMVYTIANSASNFYLYTYGPPNYLARYWVIKHFDISIIIPDQIITTNGKKITVVVGPIPKEYYPMV
jgi:hypothetical protein